MQNLYKPRFLYAICVLICAFKLILNQDINSLEDTALAALNSIRARYRSPGVSLNDALSNSAQNYADYLAQRDSGLQKGSQSELESCARSSYLSERNSLGQAATTFCGESQFITIGSTPIMYETCNPSYILDVWEAESNLYNFTYPPTDEYARSQVEHFTQVVW